MFHESWLKGGGDEVKKVRKCETTDNVFKKQCWEGIFRRGNSQTFTTNCCCCICLGKIDKLENFFEKKMWKGKNLKTSYFMQILENVLPVLHSYILGFFACQILDCCFLLLGVILSLLNPTLICVSMVYCVLRIVHLCLSALWHHLLRRGFKCSLQKLLWLNFF